jgi:hypothetical protein
MIDDFAGSVAELGLNAAIEAAGDRDPRRKWSGCTIGLIFLGGVLAIFGIAIVFA